jgi:hypothetical protein
MASRFRLPLLAALSLSAAAAQTPAELPRADAHGNPIRRAPTGHVSNYDESKVGAYTLPPLLVLSDGTPVADAATWYQRRRPELLELYRRDIYGRVPATAPRVQFRVVESGVPVLGGRAVRKIVAGHFGEGGDGPTAIVVLYLPAAAAGPVPVLLHLTFLGDPSVPASAGPRPPGPRRPGPGELGPIPDIIARGYGYAVVRYTQIEPDAPIDAPWRGSDGRIDPSLRPIVGVRTLALAPGQTRPGPDEWGTISAWAWGASRILDYLQTDPAVDPDRVALVGHSRLGKTVLWAGAQDPRFALVYSSCAGEMGTSLARRDYGETIDDMAANFPWQFAGNFQRYAGRWNDMPVDTHMAIALNAPHPLFVGGGTLDQWADPHGEFLGEVAAGPVYRLVGRSDLGTATMPPPDTPLMGGDLGFHYHTGGHAITATDWKAFLVFADKYLKAGPAAHRAAP